MKTVFLSLVGLLICQFVASAQHYQRDTTILNSLNQQILRYQHATLKDEVAVAVELTHPEMVKLMGGAEKMRLSAQKGKEIRDQYKMKVEAFNYELPDSVLVTTTSYQVAFPIELVHKFESDGEILKDRMMMIAVKALSEGKWYFMTVPMKNLQDIKQVLTFLDPALKIPE